MQGRNFTEEEILELVKDENFRRQFFSALKQLMEENREKTLTEIVSYQSSIYTVTRDVEEIHLLPEAVEKVLPSSIYTVDIEGNLKITEEAKKVLGKYFEKYGKTLDDYLSEARNKRKMEAFLRGLEELSMPFDVDNGWQWVVKMLKNLTVKTTDFLTEYYPIDVSLPEPIYRQDKKIGDMYQVGIKKKLKTGRKAKTVFEPLFSVSIIFTEEGRKIVFINGINISEMSLKDLNEIMGKISNEKKKKEAQLNKLEEEYEKASEKDRMEILNRMKEISAELLKLNVEEKLWDKSIFFLKTVSSSRLNQVLKKILREMGLVPMRKNRDILIEDFLSDDELQKKLVLIRVLGDILKDIAEENTELVKQFAKNIPSLSKLKKRYFLIEEIALLGEKEIRTELMEKYQEAIKKLEDFIARKIELDLEKDETIKLALKLSEKMKLPENLKNRFQELYEDALRIETELSFIKLLSWDEESFTVKSKKLEEALNKLAKRGDEKLLSSISEYINKALQELTKEAQSNKDIKRLGDILLQKYSILKKLTGLKESSWFKEAILKIQDINFNKARDIQKLYDVNFQILKRKKRRVKL